MYSNTSQTRGSKLAKFSNSRFLSLFFTSKLAVPLLSTQIRDFCYFLSPKIREFGGITVITLCFGQTLTCKLPGAYHIEPFGNFNPTFWIKKSNVQSKTD